MALGVAFFLLTLVMMPLLQGALNALETSSEQVTDLDTNWNTVTVPAGEHRADSGMCKKGDTITVQFLVTTALIVDRDNSVDFYIMDQMNYQRYCDGEDFDPIFASPDHESGTFSEEVPTSDLYFVVFDNSDDFILEPDEEVKYRFVVYSFKEDESVNPTVAFLLLLPSLVLMGTGGLGFYGSWLDEDWRPKKGKDEEGDEDEGSQGA
jgi:hypothetical protein